MATAPRATSAHLSLALSPAERAAVAVELAGLSARVTSLAARLDACTPPWPRQNNQS